MTESAIYDYVMNTPGNTNPIILKQMLNSLGSTSKNKTSVHYISVDIQESDSAICSEGAFEAIQDMMENNIPMVLVGFLRQENNISQCVIENFQKNEEGFYEGWAGNSTYHWKIYPDGTAEFYYDD